MPIVPEYASVSLRNLDESKIGSIATYACHTGYEIRDETNTVGQFKKLDLKFKLQLSLRTLWLLRTLLTKTKFQKNTLISSKHRIKKLN